MLPTLLPLFVLSLLLQAGVDWLLGKLGVYEHVWHPALFRWCLLAVIFGGLALPLYH